jgi:hypothetical protein
MGKGLGRPEAVLFCNANDGTELGCTDRFDSEGIDDGLADRPRCGAPSRIIKNEMTQWCDPCAQ